MTPLEAPSPLIAALEAVLFAAGRPLSPDELAQILRVDMATVGRLVETLQANCRQEGRGLLVERVAGGYQLCTRPDLALFVGQIGRPVKTNGLTQAALEVLAIVAYRQPIGRAEIETLRGVRSDAAIASLLERDLIQETSRAAGPGRPILYGTTEAFLVHFGLDSLAELPPFPQREKREAAAG